MRINFFGGPGAGKSTTTARVFSQLKERKYSVEHVGEYVKAWAFQKRAINKWDQVYIFGKQQQYEYRFLSSGVKNIVTDSPCLLSSMYSSYYGQKEISACILALCLEYEDDHPCKNIFLHRGDKEYIHEGRYQDIEEAKKLDAFMLKFLRVCTQGNFVEIGYGEQDKILETVLAAVE